MRKIFTITALMIFTIAVLATSVSAQATLFCLEDGQTIKFSECNSNIADRTCESTTCQFCVTEIAPGVYCPASLNSCNGAAQECLPFDDSENEEEPDINIEINNTETDNNETNNNETNNDNNDGNQTNNETNNTNPPSSRITLLSPNDNHSEDEETLLNFQYEVEQSFEIDFCELILNNQSAVTSNERIQSHTNTLSHLVSPGSYLWRIDCTTRNNPEVISSFSRSLNVGGETNNNVTEVPQINVDLASPANNLLMVGGSQQVSFNFNVSDIENISYCNFLLNNAVSSNTTEINSTTEINATILNGQHVWGIECFDENNNSFSSEQRNLTLSAPAAPTSNSGSSGGGSSSSDDNCCYAAVQKRLAREAAEEAAAEANNTNSTNNEFENLADDNVEEEVDQTGFSRITGAVVAASNSLDDRNRIGLAVLILAALGASGYMAYRNTPAKKK